MAIMSSEEWMKTAKNIKKPKEGEELSAYDKLENRTLYDQYVKEASALQAKNEAEAKLSSQTETALRDNYIAQAQAQKKAEEAIKMSGMTSGLSESSLVDLYAKGAAARASILNANNDTKNEILSKYQDALASARSTANSSLAQIETERDTYAKANDIDQFANALSIYENDGDFEDLKAAYDKFGGQLDETENYDLIQKYENHKKDYDKATIDVTSEDFDVSEFGDFFGMGREDSAQHDYLEQIVADIKEAKEGNEDKIKVGQYIVPNLGKHLDKRSYVYQYLGNGRIKKVEIKELSLGKGRNGDLADLDVYTPTGYEYKNNGWKRLFGTTKVKQTGETEQEKAQKAEFEAWKKEHPEQFKELKNMLLNPVGQKYKNLLKMIQLVNKNEKK